MVYVKIFVTVNCGAVQNGKNIQSLNIYGYQVERVYPDRERTLPEYGPSVSPLKAFCWKVRRPPKMKHFLWQVVSRCNAVKKNIRARGLQGDTICARCGGTWGIHKSCVLWMSAGGSSLGILTNSIESRYLLYSIIVYKYGSFILEILSGIRKPSICIDFMIHMEKTKQQSL